MLGKANLASVPERTLHECASRASFKMVVRLILHS
jgi:hypothetical protein